MKRTDRIIIRLTTDEKIKLKQKAKQFQMTVSEFMREIANAKDIEITKSVKILK